MALKPCRECKKKVSTEATACPSCGAPNPTFDQSEITLQENFISKGIEDFKRGFYGNDYVKKNITTQTVKSSSKIVKPEGKYFFNGTETLAITFWGYFIGGNAVFNLLLYLMGPNPSDGGVQVLLIFFGVVWNILAVMGVFNSADIYKAEKIKIGQTYGIATAAKVATVVLILSRIGNAL
jgi:hypothetical protein